MQLIALLLLLQIPLAVAKAYPPRVYTLTDYDIGHPRPCHLSCDSGACSYEGCGRAYGGIDTPEPTCNGGACDFADTAGASCHGGSCTFIGGIRSTCGGGGCRFVNPTDTLKEDFCVGGGCSLNGVQIESTFRGKLTH